MLGQLQTDPDFPAFATDASPTALQAQESMLRQNEVASFLSRWTETLIETPDGRTLWVLAQEAGAVSASEEPWGLTVVSARSGVVKVNLGDIIDDASDVTKKLEISGPTQFQAKPGDICRLKIVSIDSPSASIENGSPWTGFPSAYQVSGSGPSAEFAASYWPLWEFFGSSVSGSFQISETLHAKRLAPKTNLLVGLGTFRNPNKLDRPVPVARLVSFPAAVSKR